MAEQTENSAPEQEQTQAAQPAPEPEQVPESDIVNLDARSAEEREKEGLRIVNSGQVQGKPEFLDASTLVNTDTAPEQGAAAQPAEQPDQSSTEGESDDGSQQSDSKQDAAVQGDGKPESPGDQTGELPEWMKRRLERSARQKKREIQEAVAARDAEIAKLRARLGEGDPAPTTPQAADTDTSTPEAEGKTEDGGEEYYPLTEDYPTEKAWMDAVMEFHRGNKVEKPKTAAATQPADATPSEPVGQPQPQPTPGPVAHLENMLGVLVEKLSTEDGPLSEDFIDLWNKHRFGALSPEVVEYLIDSKDGTAIARQWVEKPYLARKIGIKPVPKQMQALRALAAESKDPAKTPQREEPGPVVPEVSPLRPSAPGHQITIDDPNITPDDYIKMRQAEEQAKNAVFVQEKQQ